MTEWVPFEEQGVSLSFHHCDVLRWDQHEAYRRGLQTVDTTKAVDFVVLTAERQIALIEMKDFRGHRIENKPRLSSNELAREVADKVRDTLAGMTWACARPHADTTLHRIVNAKYAPRAHKLTVILWLDRDDRGRGAEATSLQSAIASKLRSYLDVRVVVTSLHLQRRLPATEWTWLQARSLPRANRR